MYLPIGLNAANNENVPEKVKEVSSWIKWLQDIGLLSPAGIIGVIACIVLFLFFAKPEVMGRIRLVFVGFFVAFRWARRESVKRKFELDINQESRHINKELGVDLLSHEPDIKWVSETTRDAFIKNNKVVIRLSYHDDKNRTFALASLGFVRKSLLEVAKQYVPENVMECSSLLVTRRMLEKFDPEALNYLHTEILQPLFRGDEDAKIKFDELTKLDNQSLFLQMFLPEILEMGKRLYPRPYSNEKLKIEIEGLIQFLYAIATRGYDEEVPLEHSSTLFSVAIVMLAKKETLQSRGLQPYKKSVEILLRQGYRNVYLLARNKTQNYAHLVGDSFKNHALVSDISYRKGVIYLDSSQHPIEGICVVMKAHSGQILQENEEVS